MCSLVRECRENRRKEYSRLRRAVQADLPCNPSPKTKWPWEFGLTGSMHYVYSVRDSLSPFSTRSAVAWRDPRLLSQRTRAAEGAGDDSKAAGTTYDSHNEGSVMRQVGYTDPTPDHLDQAPLRRGRAGGLLRRTFIIAVVLVSGGLITSSAIELVFRYRESVEGIWSLQREVARGAAFEIQQFVRDIEHTLRAATQTPDILAAGLTEAYRFQLDKLLKVAPAITTAVALDATGRERLKVSRGIADEMGKS